MSRDSADALCLQMNFGGEADLVSKPQKQQLKQRTAGRKIQNHALFMHHDEREKIFPSSSRKSPVFSSM